ncbi:anaphase promoting complex subunit cdc16 [Lunasporangiospora selenospora]|uniref:Anaphase promoting complex subunit cdc16 n=1 Tax=Lunasporangiospora selenospora TaxID=979761 RepID=A0A9P6FSN1_9FUNG|nr:anaphase promoting complex subunit cdc16 [Lunasporangiospora selenospora]
MNVTPSKQGMRVIPSPFASSPASWIETQYPISSPIKHPQFSNSFSSNVSGIGSLGQASPYSSQQTSLVPPQPMLMSLDESLDAAAAAAATAGTTSGVRRQSQRYRRSFGPTIGGRDFSITNTTTSDLELDASMEHFDFGLPLQEVDRDRTMVDRLRIWRTDAIQQQNYSNAAYWGDKILSFTGDANDAFWLAQVYSLNGEYERAIDLLETKGLLQSSVACRYLASLCSIRQEKWAQALEYLGEENQDLHITEGSQDDESIVDGDGGFKLEASMCVLRGIVYKQFHNFGQAKECFKRALALDVKCHDALDLLISNSMLTIEEERELMDSLEFQKQLQDSHDAEFVKMLYQTKLSKYDNIDLQDEIYKKLSAKFQDENADLLLSRAEVYYTQSRFDMCYICTKKILRTDKYNMACMPMHVVSLCEIDRKNELFMLAHELVDHRPTHALTWFAVGAYYYKIGKMNKARDYFKKATSIDAHYRPAWLGFAHSFAAEGEHDKAAAAYATCYRLLPGSHLVPMYLGMEHLRQNSLLLAKRYLASSLTICDSDPLLLNELGVLYFDMDEYQTSIKYFKRLIAKLVQSSQHLPLKLGPPPLPSMTTDGTNGDHTGDETKKKGSSTLSVELATSAYRYPSHRRNNLLETAHLNLGHAYRMIADYEQAEKNFLRVEAIATSASLATSTTGSSAYPPMMMSGNAPMSTTPGATSATAAAAAAAAMNRDASTKALALSALGFIYQIQGRLAEAVEYYHKTLAIRPMDPVANEMLQRVLDERVNSMGMEWMKSTFVPFPEDMRDEDVVEARARQIIEMRVESPAPPTPLSGMSGSSRVKGKRRAMEDDPDAGEYAVMEGPRRKGKERKTVAEEHLHDDHYGRGQNQDLGEDHSQDLIEGLEDEDDMDLVE